MRIPIYYKITLIFAIAISVVFVSIYLYFNSNLRDNTYLRLRSNLKKQVLLVKYLLEKNLTEDISYQEADTITDKIGRDLDVRVTIISLDGTVLGDSELDGEKLLKVENHLYRPEVQMALKSGMGESRRFSTTIKKDMLYIATTYGKNKSVGIARLSMPLLEIEMVSHQLRKTVGISLFIACVLAIIISLSISVFISKPIKEMSIAAKEIAKGDFSKRILFSSKDEIGDLAKAFNDMAEEIRLRIQEVLTSRSRLEAVLLSMFEGVMAVDLNGTILLMNQTLRDFLQIEEEPIGRRPIEVIRNIEIHEIVDAVLRSQEGVQSREVSVLFPQEKILLVHAAAVIREGKPEGAVLVFHDITNLRQLEKIRQDFVANVSHELRTPVSSIKGYAETLLEGALNDKENAKDFLKIIYTDSERLAKLIDDLLDLSKIESGRLKLNLKVCAVEPIVKRVVSGLNNQAKAKSLTISLDFPKDIPNVMIDEVRIAQVLLNLIDNAIKYTNEGGKITISAKKQDGFIQIYVSDTGIGIPEKDLPRLFERFYRVDKARSRELGGTGLGLSIVKHIVQVHNGKVWVESVVGQGSTFSFTIPTA